MDSKLMEQIDRKLGNIRMKLYELPGRPVKPIKIYGLKDDKGPIVVFYHHIDGMYSYCTVGTEHGPVVHLSASTPLVTHEDGYKVAEETDSGRDKENSRDTVK